MIGFSKNIYYEDDNNIGNIGVKILLRINLSCIEAITLCINKN
jgi:hypothetical protein